MKCFLLTFKNHLDAYVSVKCIYVFKLTVVRILHYYSVFLYIYIKNHVKQKSRLEAYYHTFLMLLDSLTTSNCFIGRRTTPRFVELENLITLLKSN